MSPSSHEDPTMSKQGKNYEKNQKPATKSSSMLRFWLLLVCGVSLVALGQLDVSVLSLSSVFSTETTGGKRPIRQISVLGERNSGTRWTWG